MSSNNIDRAVVSSTTPSPLIMPKCTVHQPGLVQIHGILTLEEQIGLVNEIMQVGNTPSEDGFWEMVVDKGGQRGTGGTTTTYHISQRVLNSTRTRGRMYRAIDQYGGLLSTKLTQLGARAHKMAHHVDPTGTPSVKQSTHALILYYATNRGIGEHRDDSPNDGSSDQPVISFNLGKAIDFSVRHTKTETKIPIRIESGDVLLFGGPCRNILHSVSKIHPLTNPLTSHGIDDNRWNITLRYAPETLGNEEAYKFFKPVQGTSKSKNKPKQNKNTPKKKRTKRIYTWIVEWHKERRKDRTNYLGSRTSPQT